MISSYKKKIEREKLKGIERIGLSPNYNIDNLFETSGELSDTEHSLLHTEISHIDSEMEMNQ